ncbi:MAG: cytidylate kinase-like family protein [bacterium]
MLALTDQLVEKSFQQFTLRAKLAKIRIKSSPEWTPDITISRDPGSGGSIIAQKVARKLGWDVLDKDILNTLSKQLGIPEKEFARIDETPRSWLADTFNSLFNPQYVSDVRYLTHLKHLFFHAAKKGYTVIVGRGANHILPADKCLRVRVTASLAKRIKNTMHFEKKTKLEASLWVKKVENNRNGFIRQYFGCAPYEPKHFDIVVNTDHLTLLQARNLIINAYFSKFPEEKSRLKSQ